MYTNTQLKNVFIIATSQNTIKLVSSSAYITSLLFFVIIVSIIWVVNLICPLLFKFENFVFNIVFFFVKKKKNSVMNDADCFLSMDLYVNSE